MPRVKTTIPTMPSREKGQRSLDDNYINRLAPRWAQPHWRNAEFWRAVVANIPAATDCREYLISYVSSLDWKIEPRDSNQRDELKEDINYHTELFESGGYYDESGWDYLKMIEWGLRDALDIPFGMGFETIREGDRSDGKVLYIIPIDGSTLRPTGDKQWPVAQQMVSNPTQIVVFPSHAINRFYYSPRTEFKFEGWGMAPPEKIFLAIEMIRLGDSYYAKFLSDTPESGILDLIDMEEDAAVMWIKAFQDLFTGVSPMKIPVLYGHEKAASWLPFGKDPHALQFDTTYAKYVTLTCAGYGLSPTDIGFPSKGGGGGETMSGSIRDERRTKRTGIARTKKGLKYFFDRMLPKALQFTWIDLDDEASVAIGRARLAGATAANQYIQNRMFSPKEMRLQTIADGLITIPVPEEIPEDEFKVIDDANQKANERPGMLGAPINPSQGGKGEILSRGAFGDVLLGLIDIPDIRIRKLAKSIIPVMDQEINTVFSELEDNELDYWVKWHNHALWGDFSDIPELTLSTIDLSQKAIQQVIKSEGWLSFPTQDVTKIVGDLTTFFSDYYADKIAEKSMRDYENSVSKSYVTKDDVEVPDEVIKQFKSAIRGKIRQFLSDLDISKSIIAGVRNAIIKTGIVELLDNNKLLNDNVIAEVRNQLADYYCQLINEFEKILEQTLEEDLNG